MELKGLSLDEISTILSTSRTRNMYGPKLLEFLESDEAAINPQDAWPTEFKDKKVTTLYQGFNNAIKNGNIEGLEIRQMDEKLFILNTEKVKLAMDELADAA